MQVGPTSNNRVKKKSGFTQPQHNGGAARPAEGRNEFCFRRQNELWSAAPPACPSRGRDAFGPHGTSRQSNTHSTESREIRYPWHPWYGRSVWIHGAFVKGGQAVYRCSLEQNHEARLFEIPQWMFDSGACCRVHRAENAAVNCAALQALKLLLHRARSPARDLVVQAQHHSAPGGADARIGESIEGSSKRVVLPTPAESGLAKATARNQTTDCGTTGATAAPTRPKNSDRPSGKGERR
jgi:hypothetical protein